MYFKNKVEQGFSLVEMLVAVSILLIIIVGPMTVTSRASNSSAFASEQVQAFFLVQEGLELAEKARDELLLRGFLPPSNANYLSDPWDEFTETGPGGLYRDCYTSVNSNGCGLEWDEDGGNPEALRAPISCATITNCKIKYKAAAERAKFTYSTLGAPPDTPFTRTVKFISHGNNAVEIRSEVTWRSGSLIAQQKVEAQTFLYNIYATP